MKMSVGKRYYKVKTDQASSKDARQDAKFTKISKDSQGRIISEVNSTSSDQVEPKSTSSNDIFKAKKTKIWNRLIISSRTKGVIKQAKKQLGKTAIFQSAQESQHKIRIMQADYKTMKSHEKSPVSKSLKERYELLKDRYNIASSSDLLLLIKDEVKSIPKIKEQVKNEKKELDQLKEKVKSDVATTFTQFRIKIEATNSEYRKEIREHKDKIKSLKASMESAELSPEDLKSTQADLKNVEDRLEAIKENCKSHLEMLAYAAEEGMQKQVDLYKNKLAKLENSLNNLPENKKSKYDIAKIIKSDDLYQSFEENKKNIHGLLLATKMAGGI